MSNFDVNGYNSHECDIHNHGYYLGAQSQQAKIDELQKLRSLDEMEINQLAQANQVWRTKCDELQARIDEALRHVVDHGGYDDLTHVINILKGNKDEN